MSTPRRPYVRVPLDIFEDALERGASDRAVFFLGRLLTHRDKRSAPGLLARGPAGVAETLKGSISVASVQRWLRELEATGLVMTDFKCRPPLVYVLGAVQADPPTTENSARGMALQLRELPAASPVVQTVKREIEEALAGSQHLSTWHQVLGSPPPESSPEHGPESGPDLDPLRDPPSVSSSACSDTTTAAATAGDAVARAWSRLPRPPFAAAADEDLRKARKELSDEELDRVVIELAASGWATGRMHTPPTLRQLLQRPEYRARIIRGEFAATSSGTAVRAVGWQCRDCGVNHRPTAACSPPCRGCQKHHAAGVFCRKLAELERHEEERDAGTDGKTVCERISEVRASLSGRPRT